MNRTPAKLITISALVVGAGFFALLADQAPEYATAYLILFAMASLVIVSGSKLLTGELHWFSPHFAFLGGYFLMYVAASTAVIFYEVPSDVYQRPLTPNEAVRSLLLLFVGLCCYLLGWRLGPKKQTMPRGLEWFLTDTPAVRATFDYVCFGLMIAGFVAWMYIFSFAGGITGQLSSIQNRGYTAAEAGGWVLHIAFFSYMGVLLYFSRYGFNLISIGSIAFFLFLLLVFGSRSYAGTLILGVLAVYVFRFRGKLPLVVWIVAGTALFVLMTFWVLLRQTAGQFDEAADMYKEQMSTTEGVVLRTLGNMMFVRKHAEWMDVVGVSVPEQWGKTFLVLLRVIPNKIWPQKEQFITSGAQLYLQTFFPERIGKVSLSSPLFIEFYLNFLYPGVIVLSFATGVTLRWLDSVMLRHPHRRYQVPHIVIAALMVGITFKCLKQGSSQLLDVYYLIILPMAVVYFPNIPLLFNPPPDAAAQELGDVPRPAALGPFERA